mmetsp:Transcript_46055/g.127962  ORF Transcript_46055/g.127962 Transcript_46055/m.127962 type:complete len:708 (+) Transcript_46055:66-2189(+)
MAEIAVAVAAAAFLWPEDSAALFQRILQNVLGSPEEAKFRRLRLSNARIGGLVALPGAREGFLSIGWVATDDGEVLELPPGADLTPMALTVQALGGGVCSAAMDGVEATGGSPLTITVLRGPLRTRLELNSQSTVAGLSAAIERSAELGRMQQGRQRLLAGYPPQVVRQLRDDGKPYVLEELGLKTVMLEDVWEELVNDLRSGKVSFVQLREVFARPALAALALRDNRGFVRERAEAMLKARIVEQSLEEVQAARRCFQLLWPPGDPATHDARVNFCGQCAFATVSGGRRPPPSREQLEQMDLRQQLRAMAEQAAEQERVVPHFVLEVERHNVFACGVERVAAATPQELHQPLEVRFAGEVAEDAGGLRREFFNEFGRAVARAEGLWQLTPTGSLVPTPAAVAAAKIPDAATRQASYRACGRIFGLALCQAQETAQRPGGAGVVATSAAEEHPQPLLLGLPLARSFVRALQGNPAETLEELQAELNAVQHVNAPDIRGSKEFRERSLQELGLEGQLSFSVSAPSGGVMDLVPGGRDIQVTDETKAAWLKASIFYELFGCIEEAAGAFRVGVCDLVGAAHLVLLSAEELRELWSGRGYVSDEDLQTWQARTDVNPVVAQQAQWLFDSLRGELRDARPRVLKFATGSDRWPVDSRGFSFAIEPGGDGDECLPSAMTCGNMLQLPRYTRPEVLQEKLLQAVDLGMDLQVA